MKTKVGLLIILLSVFFIYEEAKAQAPAWAWAKSAGGSNDDWGNSIVSDVNGNTYVTGSFKSPTITFGTFPLLNVGGEDIFVVKYDASGNVVWANSSGGTGNDRGYSIAVDINGNTYITGYFISPTITFGIDTLTNTGGSDIFVVKYNSLGNIVWAKSAVGSGSDIGFGTAANDIGNFYITGNFNSSTISFDGDTLINVGSWNIFIVKYDSSGNVIWAKSAGGVADDYAYHLAVDINGNTYITGLFHSDTVHFDNYPLINTGGIANNLFIVKYDSSGNVAWAKGAAGTGAGYSVAVDVNGNSFLTGYFDSSIIAFDNDSLANGGDEDIFIVKYDSLGNVAWAKGVGGINNDNGNSLIVDVNGNSYVTGYFESPTIAFDTFTLAITSSNFYVVKYNTSGNAVWAKSALGGFGVSEGIAIDTNRSLFITGSFQSPIITFGNTTLTNANPNGNRSDIFIVKLDSTGTTGLAEQTPINNITLYPNPATDYLTIKTNSNKKHVITITDITGKIIYTTTTLSDKTIINTKDFSQGVYAVSVQTADFIETKKIIVVR
ncbi:MAG: SBBP repeat-containing protein [Bacteroidia bacterium]